MVMSVRLDKWLQVSRVFRTRSQATRACNAGRVKINGEVAKAHRPLHLEDRIEIQLRNWARILVVKELRDKPLPKAESSRLYEDHSPPRPPRDTLEFLLRAPLARREKGAGRPTKRERRQQERWRRG
jgi:ribosome-associated heat shock protein Hsp15